MTIRTIAPALAGALLLAAPSLAATALSPLTLASVGTAPYTQNFDTLAPSGSSNVLPTGWQVWESGTSNAVDGQYVANNGSANTGGAYSYGATGSTDRALGSLTSGTNSPITFGFLFNNISGSTITALDIAFTGEQWRLSNATADTLSFQYSTNATDVSDNGGTWNSFNPLSLASIRTGGTSAGTALDGNDSANQASIAAIIGSLSIANGSTFAIRWRDLDVTGGDNGLAVDNFSLTASTDAAAAVPEPASWAMMVAGFGLLGGALRRRRAAFTFA